MKSFKLVVFILLVNLSCNYDELHSPNDLRGTWKWKQTCGGFVGCIVSSGTNYQTLVISSSEFRSDSNGQVTTWGYTVTNVTTDGSSKIYELEFESGTIATYTVQRNVLGYSNGIASIGYVRLN